MTKKTRSEIIKRRLASSWSSLFGIRESELHAAKLKPKVNNNWRVKDYELRLNDHRSLVVSLRRFRVSKSRRSKRNNQIVIPIFFTSVKQLIIQKRTTASTKRTPKKYVFEITIHPRTIVSYTLIIAGLLGIGVFGYSLTHDSHTKKLSLPEQVIPFSTPEPIIDYTKPITLSRSPPVRIKIPSIGIDTRTDVVGRLVDGTMETPDVLSDVTAWYKYSPTPGELGPSIIVGHVDSYNGPSIFWRLRELKPDDTIEISRADGSIAIFKVKSLHQFDQANFPTQEVYGDINYAGLRLITCGGTFNSKTGHYTENTVVFATLVNS